MLSDHLKLAPLLTALGIVSCGGHALIPPPPAGSPECEDTGGWTLCSDGKWHNGEDILPQCPAGTVPGGRCTEGCFQMQDGLCQQFISRGGQQCAVVSSPCPQ
jgi:hypothetical protein